MDKKNKTFIIRPDRRMLCGTIIALGVVVAWELFSNIILGKSNSPRWAYKGEAAAIGLMFLCMSRTCFYTFQKDRIVERFWEYLFRAIIIIGAAAVQCSAAFTNLNC